MAKFIHGIGPIVKVSTADILGWQAECKIDVDNKHRFCAHPDSGSIIHEMIISHTKQTIVPVHRHKDKSESFFFINGRADVLLWNDDGTLIESIPMGPYGGDWYCYYRLNQDIYHSLKIISPVVVFLEVTTGPWHKEDLILAPWWKPPEGWHR